MLFSANLVLLVIAAASGLFLIRGIFIALYSLRSSESRDKAAFWAALDVVGVPSSGLFAQTRALLSSLTSVHRWTHNGYNNYSKPYSLPFALPTIWTGGPVAVLPPSAMHVLYKPESELKAFNAQLQTIQLPYIVSDRDIYMNVIHFDVVRKYMVQPKHINRLAAATADEVDEAFADCWGTSTEWKTVNAWDACGRIVTRTATRILIGLPMCRNEDFFEQSRLFSDAVMSGTVMINCLPPMLRSVIGPLFALRAKYYQARCLKILTPFVEERIRIWKNGMEDVPDDFLQWMIPRCAKEGPEQMEPAKLANRLLTLNVMFVIGMAYVFAHCVLDVYGSPDRDEFVNGMEAECREVSSEYSNLSTKEAVGRLYRVDSAIRESMRVSNIAVTALSRDVTAPYLDLGNGLRIPRGVRVVFPTQSIHQDPDNYKDPLRFDAFRFSRAFEDASDITGIKTNGTGQERTSCTTITPSFLSFGYGKHSCPGRWFSAQTMKQALACALLNYDVEVVNRAEKRRVVSNTFAPATEAQIRVRRRKKI